MKPGHLVILLIFRFISAVKYWMYQIITYFGSLTIHSKHDVVDFRSKTQQPATSDLPMYDLWPSSARYCRCSVPSISHRSPALHRIRDADWLRAPANHGGDPVRGYYLDQREKNPEFLERDHVKPAKERVYEVSREQQQRVEWFTAVSEGLWWLLTVWSENILCDLHAAVANNDKTCFNQS